ncbi:hypothetical protein D915_008997 [Fasciola hepatica]|uniref:Uncharacterized protein n=1 Tax=Fasciola hepatica TaxID=6192 RepID=A0A4E0RGI9_FASHE|nr:hypothetical protein D915_008997 [Fasciola hepatica]
MFRKFVALLTVFSVCLSVSDAARCYECTSCPLPFSPTNVTVKDNCPQCLITQTLLANEVKLEVRSCVPVCKAQDALVSGTGVRVGCCSTDLCNEKYNTSNRFAPFNVGLLGLLTIILLKIRF